MNQFKVGDWIKSTKYLHLKPIKIESIYESNNRKGDFGLKCKGTVHYTSESELWQPKAGEWCWFYNHNTDIPNFMMFSGMAKDNLFMGTVCKGGRNIEFDYCEPFIGELPSFIKDKQ